MRCNGSLRFGINHLRAQRLLRIKRNPNRVIAVFVVKSNLLGGEITVRFCRYKVLARRIRFSHTPCYLVRGSDYRFFLLLALDGGTRSYGGTCDRKVGYLIAHIGYYIRITLFLNGRLFAGQLEHQGTFQPYNERNGSSSSKLGCIGGGL